MHHKNKLWQMAAGLVIVAIVLAVAFVLIWMNQPQPVQAESNFQRAFLAAYPNLRGSAVNDCRVCHTQGAELNPYGRDFASHGHSFQAIELLDSDLDGIANLDEIQQATLPGGCVKQTSWCAIAPGGGANFSSRCGRRVQTHRLE